ncbi:SDR family NAD(P)-dependent oxidoreductase [Rhodobacteraceae bacterium nBUS_22]|jgi:NAD(P)-dependent dehydrogenase (short-subunit alcohol dehydrogenase family)
MARPRVCVTGSTEGIGFAIAKAFAVSGARIVINSHEENISALAELSKHSECHFVQADLSTEGGAKHLIEQAYEKLGGLDTLVNNAGTFTDVDFGDLREEMFDRAFDLNVKGYLFAAQRFAEMVSNEANGASVICVGSTNSLMAEKNSVIYDSTKGAILMMVRSLAVTLADRGIRVNGIGPGIVETPLTKSGLDLGETRAVLRGQIPLGRIGDARDIGGAAVFLASPEASYITGQMLYIDGGIVARQMSWDPTN